MKTKRTRSQEKIFSLIKSLNRPISAQELFLELRKRNENMGLATVYRSLEALKLEGVVSIRTLATGESLYTSIQKDQHHLTCVNCGQSIPIDECPVHQLEKELQCAYKFKVYYHTLEFFGLCDQCQLSEQ
jgi:Fur family transcriptional regulator, ferric uptake regulator